MKLCIRCRESKPETEFHRNAANKDRLQSYCKQCRATLYKQWDISPEKRLAYRRASREKYRDKHNVWQRVSSAVRGGRIIKLPCAVCGDPEVEAHHDDYSKPLDVRGFAASIIWNITSSLERKNMTTANATPKPRASVKAVRLAANFTGAHRIARAVLAKVRP